MTIKPYVRPTQQVAEAPSRSEGSLRSLRIYDSNHLVHWRKPTGSDAYGTLSVSMLLHTEAQHMNIDTQEYASASSKRTMCTLDSNSLRALYTMLHEVFKEDTP